MTNLFRHKKLQKNLFSKKNSKNTCKQVIFLLFFTLFMRPLNASVPSIDNMSLKEKIGQLFIVCFRGDTANETSRDLLLQGHISGFIFYKWSNQLQSFDQVSNLCRQLQLQAQDARCPPLFISIDQEGGRVTRLKKGFYQFPSNRALANIGILEFAYLSAKARAEELLSAGINMNLAPVIDVNSNPKNPIIGDRSFGSNPNNVTAYAKEALKGYADANIIAVVKHFPGHGDVTVDSHLALPVVDKDFSTLQTNEFVPFFELRHDTQALMTAHVLFPQIDPIAPASKSKIFLEDILRKSWNFNGLVISDSMVMKGAIAANQSVEEACLEALNAGTDIILLGGKQLSGQANTELTQSEVLSILSFLENAVKEKKIDEHTIDKKVERILNAKRQYSIGASQTAISNQTHFRNQILEREIALLHSINSLDMSQCDQIAKKVWHNETGSRKDLLMFWNANEDFISLGIGHFIWYPKVRTSSYVEDFPLFLSYLIENQIPIPQWLATQKHCPWDNRNEFLDENSSRLKEELQSFLENTMDIQGKYLLKKLPLAIHEILSQENDLKLKDQYLKIFEKLAATHNGVYAMIDYLNFKGSGLSDKERYNGKGWGLLQVVEILHHSQIEPTPENFSDAAKEVLIQRVNHSPQKEKEAQWLKGWLKRVSTYPINKKFD
jgi:beta-N-acetylhexosaminidase